MRGLLLLLALSTLTLQGCFHWRVRGDVDDRGRGGLEGEIGDGRWESGRSYRDGDRVIIYHDDAPDFVPPGHLPPPGHARVWHKGLPPGQQPPPYKLH